MENLDNIDADRAYYLITMGEIAENDPDYEKVLSLASTDQGACGGLISNKIVPNNKIPITHPLYKKILFAAIQDTIAAYHLIADKIIDINSPYYIDVFKSAVKFKDYAYTFLIYYIPNEKILATSDLYKQTVLTCIEQDPANAYSLLQRGIIKKTSPLYNKVLSVAIEDAESAYDLIYADSNHDNIDELYIDRNSPLYNQAIVNMIKGPQQSYMALIDGIINIDDNLYIEAINNASNIPAQSWDLIADKWVPNHKVSIESELYDKIFTSAIKEGAATSYRLIYDDVIDFNSKFYDRTIKSIMSSLYYIYLLIKNQKINPSYKLYPRLVLDAYNYMKKKENNNTSVIYQAVKLDYIDPKDENEYIEMIRSMF